MPLLQRGIQRMAITVATSVPLAGYDDKFKKVTLPQTLISLRSLEGSSLKISHKKIPDDKKKTVTWGKKLHELVFSIKSKNYLVNFSFANSIWWQKCSFFVKKCHKQKLLVKLLSMVSWVRITFYFWWNTTSRWFSSISGSIMKKQ